MPAKQVTPSDPAQYGIPFTGVPDGQDASIYQVNIRAFSQTQNFQGVIKRLDSIRALGVNVIYLMPIYPVGVLNSVNSPYCVKDYEAVNNSFGTLDDLRALVDGAHSRNMAVMLDWVANHTSWDNAWITEHKSWYEQDGNGNIIHPPNTNYTDVAQLNYSNTEMRLAMIKAMKYWVYTANVDGFRCDYADGPPLDFWQQAVDTLRKISTHKLLLLAESGNNDKYSAGFDFIFGFDFYYQLKPVYSSNQSALVIDNLNLTKYTGASGTQQVVRYLTNHDVDGSEGTPLDLFGGKKGSLAAFISVAYMKGVPFIYNGQEVGDPVKITFPFTSKSTVIDWTINPDITSAYKNIIAFRNSSAAVRRGQLTSYSSVDICAFTKIKGTDSVFVISNLRNATIDYSLPAALANTSWTDALNGGTVALGIQISMPAYQYVVLKK